MLYLGILKHSQVSVHAQGSGFLVTTFVEVCCLMEFPLVGIDICQKQLIVVLTPLLPLLQIRQTNTSMYTEISTVSKALLFQQSDGYKTEITCQN